MRVVIIGAGGFMGKSLTRRLNLEKIDVLNITRKEVDFLDSDSPGKLEKHLNPGDRVVFLACITPDKGKGTDAVLKNIAMCEYICQALSKKNVSHLIYLSSDTVYPINRGLISEESPTDPENMFGAMHVCREHMLKTLNAPLSILRSTLVYGAEDTHNSYGPNRLRRMAEKDGKITLFGGGEEKRDHIFVEDVTSLILLTLQNKRTGILNLATGKSISYFDLAHKIASHFDKPVDVVTTTRNNPITHRHFDSTHIYKAFPGFRFTDLDEGLKLSHQQEFNLVLK